MAVYPRVLSIQSHVVSGYVGNKSATFPLQIMGFEVDPLNSVQFSNHTGYGKFTGQILNEKDLTDLIEGLSKNNLDEYTHLLTGYVGAVAFLRKIGDIVKSLKKKNPNLIYVCDPVMGDNGHMYVPKEILPMYQQVIIPLADVITPNQFELELLTNTKISSIEDAWNAINDIHKAGCKVIVLSSSDLGNEQNLLGLASSKTEKGFVKMIIEIPKIPADFTGTGDLFASLFLAWFHKSNNNLKEALEKTVAVIQAVLRNTYAHAMSVGISKKSLELKLIQCKKDIEDPQVEILAKVRA